MKKIAFTLAIFTGISLMSFNTQAQSLGDLLKNVLGGGTSGTNNGNNTSNNNLLGSGLSNLDISNGLKQALTIGANNASSNLSKSNGFFGNQMVKILMPPEAQKVESALRQFGMGNVADRAILLMNRAAEDAVKQAGPIFVNAIKQITIQDAIGILRGGNNSATQFLQRATQQQLMTAFAPQIQASLSKVGADKVWSQAFSAYNKFNFGQQKVNTDLTQYVTQRATEGMFKTIAQEELKIRQNPVARTTDLLQKVFGGK